MPKNYIIIRFLDLYMPKNIRCHFRDQVEVMTHEYDLGNTR